MSKEPSAGYVSSRPVPSVDLTSQIAVADFIVAATVLRVSEARGPAKQVSPVADPERDRLCTASVEVLRTLAGGRAAKTISVWFLQGKTPSRGWLELQLDRTVLLFLRAVGKAYVPVAPRESLLTTFREIGSTPAGASPIEAVAHELEQIILAADPGTDIHTMVQAAMARVVLPVNVDLGQLATPVLQNPVRRAAWVAIALANGQIAALDEVESLFAQVRSPCAEAMWQLLAQKLSNLHEVRALPQLARMLNHASAELARAAAAAIRRVHDPEVLPWLIKALKHPALAVRYQVVMALAELVPEINAGPAFEHYQEDEDRYVQKWKQWWSTTGSKYGYR